MGLIFRRTKNIAPGLRANVSNTGVGVSVGTKGARYFRHSSGRRTTTFAAPGSGLSCRKTK